MKKSNRNTLIGLGAAAVFVAMGTASFLSIWWLILIGIGAFYIGRQGGKTLLS
ncbi:MAG: hypothetical protein ACPHK8_05150 [Thermoplasmatota archaeon]